MMKLRALFPLLLLTCALASSPAQAQSSSSTLKRDVLASGFVPFTSNLAQPLTTARSVFADDTSGQIAEAKRLLKARSAQLPPNAATIKVVTLAALDREGSGIQLLSLAKDSFLTVGAQLNAQTSKGHTAQVTIVRANGVNTAVNVLDTTTGRTLLPLVVEYPIEREGELRELAYYTSAHPALLSPGTVKGGETYVRAMLDRAAGQLRAEGLEIAPDIVDVAEHLCVVEHTDHKRFLADDRASLFREIYSLYALNESNTFRYSVSTAGAGGMVQMIPQTYQMVRQHHPNVPLNPDFVGGMIDHLNALSAMLLYMQDTWNDLQRSSEVRDALGAGLATEAELVAAGYNSNPARLPQYLRRGGALWRTLIPAETQMYLQIYGSLDHSISFTPRGGREPQDVAVNNGNSVIGSSIGQWHRTAANGIAANLTRLLPALSDQLLLNASLLSLGMR